MEKPLIKLFSSKVSRCRLLSLIRADCNIFQSIKSGISNRICLSYLCPVYLSEKTHEGQLLLMA